MVQFLKSVLLNAIRKYTENDKNTGTPTPDFYNI